MVRRNVYVRDDMWAYWVIQFKEKQADGNTLWRWKIVGGQLRSKTLRKGDGSSYYYVMVPPQKHAFDANNNHFPGMTTFAFNKKKEAEAWLKLVCDYKWEGL